MSGTRFRIVAGLASALTLGVAIPAVASIWVGNGEGEATLTVKVGALVPGPGQKYIFAPSNFKCNLSNLALVAKRVPLKAGKINFVGKANMDVFRKPTALAWRGTLTWKGTLTKGTIRFVAAKTPKVTFNGQGPVASLVNKKCDTGVLRYRPRP